VREHGVDEEVLKDLIAIEGVTEASLVYGEYDIHCKIDVDTMDELRNVIKEIRKLKYIVRTS
jgi:DNA-binding Lrp family transcriptional regulator